MTTLILSLNNKEKLRLQGQYQLLSFNFKFHLFYYVYSGQQRQTEFKNLQFLKNREEIGTFEIELGEENQYFLE